jgi:DNA-binding Lrp family transcriptional regulator
MAEEDKFMLVSLNDEKSKSIAEVLSSSTCKKVINYLAEKKEASQKDLSDGLDIPMNTLDYNIKKLLESGFIQKRKNFFWSKKGKKIVMYELSNKSIVISPKKTSGEKLKSILPAFILTLAGTFAIWVFEKIRGSAQTTVSSDAYNPNIIMEKTVSSASGVMGSGASSVPSAMDTVTNYAQGTLLTPHPTPLWAWFMGGALIAIMIISIVNWRKL